MMTPTANQIPYHTVERRTTDKEGREAQTFVVRGKAMTQAAISGKATMRTGVSKAPTRLNSSPCETTDGMHSATS